MVRKLLSAALAVIMLVAVATIAPVTSAEETVGPYRDVPAGKWYSDAILSMYEKGVMTGKKADLFDPDGNITRAEFVTILFRLSGEEPENGESAFTDVKRGAWYEKNVLWAAEKGLVQGYPDGTFKPNNNIKRSEMVTLLARYIDYKSVRVIPDSSAAASFPDVKSGAWYAKSLETVRVSGLIKGDNAGKFNPNATATRAEAAVLFARFCDMVDEADLFTDWVGTVHLETETGRDVESKEEYILTSFSLEASEDRSIFKEDVQIRGRGNTAWRVDKKSYKLKFPEKICLMPESVGNTKAKDWTLIACHFDRSLIRNHVGYRIARAVGGIEWTPYTEFVELYLNGEYRGIYMLAEQVEAKKGRVDVHDGEEETIGFLLELDFWSKGEYYVDYFKTMGHKYTIKTDFLNTDQVIAMKCHLETVYNVILEGDREKIESCVDIASALDMYLVNEIYKENDVGTGSVYMYFKEPNGKLFFGPVWDLDGSFGNSLTNSATNGLYAGHKITASGAYTGDSNMWYAALMTNDWFREMAKERWPHVRDVALRALTEELRPVFANIDVFEKNFEKWPILHTDIGGGAPPKVLMLNSCYENILCVDKWARERIAWLDSCFSRDDFVSAYPADRSIVEPEITGSTELSDDHTKWTIPDWFSTDNVAQIYYDQIYDLCDTEDGRIFVTLGRRDTMTVASMNLVILEEYMGVDTSRYTLFFDDEQFARAKATYGGMGNGQKIIFELKTGIRDMLTGEESEFDTLIYTFRKDLSLDAHFGY